MLVSLKSHDNVPTTSPPLVTVPEPIPVEAMEVRLAEAQADAEARRHQHQQAALAAELGEDTLEASDAALAAFRAAEDKVAGLSAALAGAQRREEARIGEARSAMRRIQTSNVQRVLARRERLVSEIAAAIVTLATGCRKLHEMSNSARLAWPGGNAPKGGMLYPDEITAAIADELYRVGGKPPRTGTAALDGPPGLPGAKPSDFRFIGAPSQIKPLADSIIEANDRLVATMAESLPQ